MKTAGDSKRSGGQNLACGIGITLGRMCLLAERGRTYGCERCLKAARFNAGRAVDARLADGGALDCATVKLDATDNVLLVDGI